MIWTLMIGLYEYSDEDSVLTYLIVFFNIQCTFTYLFILKHKHFKGINFCIACVQLHNST